MTRPEAVTGGRAVVDALLAAGVDHAFIVPGESFMGVLDALYDEPRIRVVTVRHEGGASFMAEAYGKLTGRPAVCMGTRMVGAGNMAIGIHTARQDSTPMIAIFGQVGTAARHRESFQEAELSQVFAPLAKWTVEPPTPERLGELALRAGREARYGRPGPVTIALRDDILEAHVPNPSFSPLVPPRPAPDPDAIERTLALLRNAERPLLLLGMGVLLSEATDACIRLAEALQIPVMTGWRRPDAFPNDHPLFLGQTGSWTPPSVRQRIKDADVLIAIGTRFNKTTSHSYTLPSPTTRLVHADIAAESIGGHRVDADVACVSDARLFAEALLRAATPEALPNERRARWTERTKVERETFERETTPNRHGTARPEFVDQESVIWHLRQIMAPDTIVTSDAGAFGGWVHRFLRWKMPHTFLAPSSGAMGYAIPAGIAAKLARPKQPVLAYAGDGGFLMTGSEIETAVRERTPFVTIVCDNRQYGSIRISQMAKHPGRPVATALGPVDFVRYAESLGAVGIAVRDEAEFPKAYTEAQRSGQPTVIHLRVDPEQLTLDGDAG